MLLLLLFVTVVAAQLEPEPIAPYSFGYLANGFDGSSERQEISDGSGAVKGFYKINSADGIQRYVNYIADHNGFRASINTNEPGTESLSPANVLFQSSQPSASLLSHQYGHLYHRNKFIDSYGRKF